MRGLLRVGHQAIESGRQAFEIFTGLEILGDQEMHSARLRPPYATILPRNHFTF